MRVYFQPKVLFKGKQKKKFLDMDCHSRIALQPYGTSESGNYFSSIILVEYLQEY